MIYSEDHAVLAQQRKRIEKAEGVIPGHSNDLSKEEDCSGLFSLSFTRDGSIGMKGKGIRNEVDAYVFSTSLHMSSDPLP